MSHCFTASINSLLEIYQRLLQYFKLYAESDLDPAAGQGK